MKVTELITKLQSLPPNADVLCYTEDKNLQAKGYSFVFSTLRMLVFLRQQRFVCQILSPL